MSNLVNHARKELSLLGEDPETVDGYLKIIQAFADMGHSGGSAAVAISVLPRLMSFENLTPLTANPDEWMEVGPGVWQSTRNSRMFSNDGGISYHDVNAPGRLTPSEPQKLDI